MKIYGNWGLIVPVFYFAFVAVLVAFVIWTSTQTVELVDENYYDKEVEYTQRLKKVERTNRLAEQLELVYNNNAILLQFPKLNNYQAVKGEILFFRPSEKKLDFKAKVNLDSNFQTIFPAEKMKKGLWKLKIDWADGDSTYYNEEILVIN